MTMDWNGFKYKYIAECISGSDIEEIIGAMIDNYDTNAMCYDRQKAAAFFESHVHDNEIFNMIECTALKEIKDFSKDNWEVSLDDIGDEELYFDSHKVQIFISILDIIERIAMQKRSGRFFSRLNIGEKVDFKSCVLYSPFNRKVEFCKDGGWGIAENDGVVLVKNHLTQKPSQLNSFLYVNSQKYCLIQDRDTELYGLLSMESFKEVVHCLYQNIELIEYKKGKIQKAFFKVKRDNNWGCIDDKFMCVVECKYADINLTSNYIECCRDGQILWDEIKWAQYKDLYVGKKDLYDFYGNFLIGGYDLLQMKYDSYFLFYWGTKYEEYQSIEEGWDETYCSLTRYRLNYDDAFCLILDKQFKSVIDSPLGNQSFKGVLLNSKDALLSFASLEILFKYEISIYDNHLNYLIDNPVDIVDILGESCTEEDSYLFVKQVRGRIEEYYIPPKYMKYSYMFPVNSHLNVIEFYNKSVVVQNQQIIISSYSCDHKLIWKGLADEIGLFLFPRVFRLGDKCGFFSNNYYGEAKYDGISFNSTKDHIYVALIDELDYNKLIDEKSNPNIIHELGIRICYYELRQDEILEQLPDNWDVFNPTKHLWFPKSFPMNFYMNMDNNISSSVHDSYNGYTDEWTDEDSWDAMTDGMYGEYPGNGWDTDFLGL